MSSEHTTAPEKKIGARKQAGDGQKMTENRIKGAAK
jgi:hypothetical protein